MRKIARRSLAPFAVAGLLGIAAAVAVVPGSAAVQPARLSWLHMLDARDGYALGGQDYPNYRLLQTHDGGHTWVDVTPGRGTIHPSGPVTVEGTTLLFARTLHPHVFAVERSGDGGRTWRQSLPFRDPKGLGAGQPLTVDATHLYLAVDEGAAAGSEAEALYVSGDGGRAWHFVSRTSVTGTPPGSLPFGCDKDGYGFATPTRGFAGGYCPGGALFFYRTDDGGKSWRRQTLLGPTSCACDTTAPTFFGARVGVVGVEGFGENGGGRPIVRVYWTRDGGDHWRPSSVTEARAQPIAIASPNVVWVIAQHRGRLRSPFDLLFRTDDGGSHWRTETLPFDGAHYRLDAVTSTLAYALTYTPNLVTDAIVRTTDGGRHWQRIHAALGR